MRVNLRKSNGNVSLTMLASVSAGCLFAMLFANLVRYVIALQSVHHAAEQAARCISPTNADCVSVSAPTAESTKDWFAVSQATQQTEWTDRYKYTASLISQNWEARGNGYQVHLVQKPLVEYQTFRIPRVTYRAALNQYEYRLKHIEATVLAEVRERHFRVSDVFANARTNFPEFDATYEVDTDRLSPAFWHPRVLNRTSRGNRGFRDFDELSMSAVDLGSALIPAGTTHEFSTGFFEVPLVITDSPAVTCTGINNGTCDVRPEAGQTVSNYSWKRHAAIALKLFASVRRTHGNPSIAWAGAPGAEGKHWGLQVETLSAGDYQAYKNARDSAAAAGRPLPAVPRGSIRCLGGRTSETNLNSQAPEYFNLWLRGPKGSNGGGEANCPVAQNDRYPNHDALYVERGGAYRVTGFLSADGTGAVEAGVSLRHYFDDYEPYDKRATRNRNCVGDVFATVLENADRCSGDEVCRGMKVLKTENCSVVELPLDACISDEQARNDPRAFPLGKGYCGDPFAMLTCSSTTTPELPAECKSGDASADGRIVCGTFEEVSPRTYVELPSAPPACETAQAVTHEIKCLDTPSEQLLPVNGEYGDPSACPKILEVAARLNALAAEAKQLKHNGDFDLALDGTISATWSAKGPTSERWAPAVTLPPELAHQVDNPLLIRPGAFRSPSILAIFKHQSPDWTPALNTFGFYGNDSHNPAVLSEVTLAPVSESSVAVTRSYPFANSPEFAIPEAAPGSACTGEPIPLEQRLRTYAAREIPDAADPDTVVNVTATYVDTVATSRRGSCDPKDDFSSSVPACSKTSSVETQSPVCDDRRYLGRFSAEQYPSGPPACTDASSLRCFSESLESGTSEQNPASTYDILLAQRKGLDELHRSFSAATLSCDGAFCTDIAVTRPDADHVGVQVRFAMPLTFPLSSILGKETLSLTATKTEMLEQSVAGRFALRGASDQESLPE